MSPFNSIPKLIADAMSSSPPPTESRSNSAKASIPKIADTIPMPDKATKASPTSPLPGGGGELFCFVIVVPWVGASG